MALPGTRTHVIRQNSHKFCQALISPPSPEELISTYFVSDNPKILEYGPSWCRDRLPFLHTTFQGTSGENSCLTYFELLSKVLKMHLSEDAFPGPGGFIADPLAVSGDRSSGGTVCVTGKGRFESVKTGKSYEETFMYRFSGFDNNGKIGCWEIWSDSLSAWEAVGG